MMTELEFGRIETLHELLAVAIADGRKVLAAGDIYEMAADHWHEPKDFPVPGGSLEKPNDRRCYVCLAGAVIAQSLGADPGQHLTPADYVPTTARRLDALEELRRGRVSLAKACLTVAHDYHSLPPTQIEMCDFCDRDEFAVFLDEMSNLREKLHAEGL